MHYMSAILFHNQLLPPDLRHKLHPVFIAIISQFVACIHGLQFDGFLAFADSQY